MGVQLSDQSHPVLPVGTYRRPGGAGRPARTTPWSEETPSERGSVAGRSPAPARGDRRVEQLDTIHRAQELCPQRTLTDVLSGLLFVLKVPASHELVRLWAVINWSAINALCAPLYHNAHGGPHAWAPAQMIALLVLMFLDGVPYETTLSKLPRNPFPTRCSPWPSKSRWRPCPTASCSACSARPPRRWRSCCVGRPIGSGAAGARSVDLPTLRSVMDSIRICKEIAYAAVILSEANVILSEANVILSAAKNLAYRRRRPRHE